MNWRTNSSPRAKSRRASLGVEALEVRLAPAIFRVLGNADTPGPLVEGAAGEFLAPTLRAAIDAANDEINHAGADTILFDLPAGQETIALTGGGASAFLISSDITIQGVADEPGVVLDAQGLHRHFEVAAGGALTLQRLTLRGGVAQGVASSESGRGGAIFNAGTLRILESTLHGNAALGAPGTLGTFGSAAGHGLGGAIYNDTGGQVFITNSTLAENLARGGLGGTVDPDGGVGRGGAVYNRNGTVQIRSATIAGNTVSGGAGTEGGAVFNHADAVARLARLTINYSILAGTTAGFHDVANLQDAGSAQVTASNPSIVQTDIINSGGSVDPRGVRAVDPLLGPLEYNGGPTPTMSPQAPQAIDAGNAGAEDGLTNDQRGPTFARLVGAGLDLGAVERQVVISSTDAVTFNAGQNNEFLITTEGGPDVVLTIEGTLPPGLTFTDFGDGTGLLSGTPAFGAPGDYTFTIKASAGNLQTAQTFTLSISDTPSFITPPAARFIISEEGSFLIRSVDPQANITLAGSLPAGLTFEDNGDGTATISGTPAGGTAGVYTLTLTATRNGHTATQVFRLTVREQIVAIGTDGGMPFVQIFSADGSTRFTIPAYDSGFQGGVRVAVGDINADGTPDVITGTGPGGGPHVKVFDGRTGAQLFSFMAYAPSFFGGIYVAAGDVNNDGRADIITGAGPGGGPHVRVFSGLDGTLIRDFFAYDVGFTGGVTVAAGDVNNDGFVDVITGTATGAPHVKAFDGKDLTLRASFFAYDPRMLSGINVAAGDLDGDGVADIITGTGPGAPPHVKVFDGRTGALARSFYSANSTFQTGARIAANLRQRGLTLLAANPGTASWTAIDANTLQPLDTVFASAQNFRSGIFVAGSAT